MTYSEKIIQNKEFYPFERWKESGLEFDMKQYTNENCAKARKIMDKLLDKLIQAGEHAPVSIRIELIKDAVLAYNKLSEEIDGLIETGEREDLCEVFENIAISVGLDPEDYDGDITFEWREW